MAQKFISYGGKIVTDGGSLKLFSQDVSSGPQCGDTPFTNTKSIEFDGTSDYIDVGNPLSLQITGALTISFWFKSSSTNDQAVISKDTLGQRCFAIWNNQYATGQNLEFIIYNSNSPTSVVSSTNLNDGNWHNIVCVFKPSTYLRLYVDGSLDVENTTSIPASIENDTANFIIGGIISSGIPLYMFEGNVDEVAIWNSDQSTNISTIYNNGIPDDLCTLNPLSWWRMGDGDTFPTLTDNGSGGNDGTMTNMSSGNIVNVSPNNTLAGSPTIDSISGGSEQALIYYTTGTTGTNPIIDYEYSLNSGSTWVSLSSTDNPLIVTGLTNGTTYYIQIRPITIDGAGGESNIVSVTPQGIPWEPDDANVVAWVDASDLSSYSTIGSTLTSVTDKAGTYTMNIGNTPTVVSGGLNSLNVFDFDGNGEYLQSSTYSNQTSSGNHWAVGVFLADVVDGTKDSFWSYETNQSPKRDYAVSSGANNNTWPGELDLDALSSNRISSTIGNKQDWNLQSVSMDSWVIVSCWFNKTGNQIGNRVNGNNAYTPVNDYDNSISPNQELRLMRNRASQELDGRLAEFFAVADLPGTGGTDLTDLEKAEGYLAWKWGLEGNLPVSHPYKNSAPTV